MLVNLFRSICQEIASVTIDCIALLAGDTATARYPLCGNPAVWTKPES